MQEKFENSRLENNEIDDMSLSFFRQEINRMDPKSGALVHEFRKMLMGIKAALRLIEISYDKKGVDSQNLSFFEVKKDFPEEYKYVSETYLEMKELLRRGYRV